MCLSTGHIRVDAALLDCACQPRRGAGSSRAPAAGHGVPPRPSRVPGPSCERPCCSLCRASCRAAARRRRPDGGRGQQTAGRPPAPQDLRLGRILPCLWGGCCVVAVCWLWLFDVLVGLGAVQGVSWGPGIASPRGAGAGAELGAAVATESDSDAMACFEKNVVASSPHASEVVFCVMQWTPPCPGPSVEATAARCS